MNQLDQHTRQIGLGEQIIEPLDAVELRHMETVRDIEWVMWAIRCVTEGEDSAVVRAVEYTDRRATCVVKRRPDGHQVCFSSRVGESHLIDRSEPVADPLGKVCLFRTSSSNRPAVIKDIDDCLLDRRRRMPEQSSGVVATEIDVAVTINVGQLRSLS